MAEQLDADAVRIINAHINADASIRARVTDYVTRVWGSLENLRDKDIDAFVSRILPVIQGAESQIASLTDAYLATLLTNMSGANVRPVGIDPREVTGKALRGVDPVDVYHRAGTEVWNALSNNIPFNDARKMGLNRALNMALTDLQLSKTHTARRVFSQTQHVVGTRRVLTGSENCGLCHVAATQRYHKSKLMPIHPGCDCGTAPIMGDEDPGQVIDDEGLEDAHIAIEERFGVSDRGARDPIDYRKVLLIREHGEIGPVLTVKGQHFDGPTSIPT
jgi:hypothetical protein